MVNWLFKISYTPVGPETYSSRLFMHKIPLCEALSKCAMTGVSPEVCLQSLSAWLLLQEVLQFLFPTKLQSGLLQCRNADAAFNITMEIMDLFCIKLKQFPIKKDVQSSLFCTAMLQFSVQEFLQQISEGKKIRFLGSPYSLSKLFQFNTAWLFAPRPYIPLR